MLDIPLRLWVAYGLIGLLLSAGLAAILWLYNNTHARRTARDRARQVKNSSLHR